MSNIQIFQNQEFGSIRTLEIDGEPWFVGKDVSEILGYAKPLNALALHVDEDDFLKHGLVDNIGRIQETIFINESGLYSLILSSKLPSARKVKRWITNDVLPSIRKNGLYMTDNLMKKMVNEPQFIIAMAKQIINEKERADLFEQKLSVTLPKADYFDQFVNAADCTNIRDTSKELGIPQSDFVRFLLDKKFLYRNAKGMLRPYGVYCQKEYFILKDCYICQGEMLQQTLITCKGKNHLMKLIKKECE